MEELFIKVVCLDIDSCFWHHGCVLMDRVNQDVSKSVTRTSWRSDENKAWRWCIVKACGRNGAAPWGHLSYICAAQAHILRTLQSDVMITVAQRMEEWDLEMWDFRWESLFRMQGTVLPGTRSWQGVGNMNFIDLCPIEAPGANSLNLCRCIEPDLR